MHGIERYRMQTWRLARVSGRTSQRFAIRHVLYPASAKKRHADEMQHKHVMRMVHRLHRLWFMRVKDLIINQLWKPGDVDATVQTDLWTFRRILHCRPSCVFFRKGNRTRVRPCAHYKFCPFCWGRVAAFLYRRFKGQILRLRAQQPKLVLHCRVSSHFLPATGFDAVMGLSPEDILVCGRALKDIFDAHRAAYQKVQKALQRKTLGSAWRLVVDPQEKGWIVEVRQVILAKPARTVPPWVKYPGASTVFERSVKLTDDHGVYELLGRFLEYPSGMLTSYAELTAVYLQAGYRARLATGTGIFRACANSLIQAFKKETKDGKRQDQKEEDRKLVERPGAD